MFFEETCERCGTCLSNCPFLEISVEEAKMEIDKMIRAKKKGNKLKNCLGCLYCNTVCPNQSNPADLISDINNIRVCEKGVGSLLLITEEIPLNLMSIGLKIETKEKEKDLIQYLNPSKNKEMFYLGCSLSCFYTDIPKTALFEELPKIGGIKYCCGSFVKSFGEGEIKIKGRKLLEDFKKFEVKKMVTFCPGCSGMMKGVYPKLLPEFERKIECQTISEYLVEKYHKDELKFTSKIEKKITFHDPCPWRNLDEQIYEAPRELLEIIGAEIVEMKHNRKKSLCCGAPALYLNRELYKKIVNIRVQEVEDTGASTIAVSCTGCFALARTAAQKNIETYNITELVQMAIGEKPPHRVIETSDKFRKKLVELISENPRLLTDRYVIKNGKIRLL